MKGSGDIVIDINTQAIERHFIHHVKVKGWFRKK